MLSIVELDRRLDPVALTETQGWAAGLPYDMDDGNYIVGFATREDAWLVANALRYTSDTSYMNS